MIAASIIHFYYISSTAWAWLYVISCCSRLLAVTDRRGTDCSEAQTLSSLLASSITGLVWMPNLLTVIAELSSTAFSSTCKFGAAGTSKCDHGISAVRSRAPPTIRICNKPTPKHKLLIFFHQDVVIQYQTDIVRIEPFGAFWTADVNSAFRDFYPEILTQAIHARSMVTCHYLREPVLGVPQKAQGAFHEVSAWLAARGCSIVGRGTCGENRVLVCTHF